MKNFLKRSKNFILDLLFPCFCLGCGREGDYLCEDCLSTIDINYYLTCPVCNRRTLNGKTCQTCKNKTELTGLFWVALYQNPLVKKTINQLKYEARLKDVSRILAGFIIKSFEMMGTQPQFAGRQTGSGFVLIPVPLTKKKLKQRGFNQAEQIAKHLSNFWQIPLLCDVLIKNKKTASQADLNKKQRQENVRGAFKFLEPPSSASMRQGRDREIKGLKVLLVDDVYTTGSTMSECARVLKESGASEVWGIVVARE